MSKQSLEFEQHIRVPPSQVYYAFTNATALREWLCDVATTLPQPGGRLYLAWHRGYYACGEYTALEKDKEVAFTWQGRGEPGQTQVRVSLSEKDDGTLVSLAHERIGAGEGWAQPAREFQTGWKNGLENLTSVLETGEDLRFTLRPMLGIIGNDFTPEQAKALGVPVTEGLRLGGVVEGLGAQNAGLQADDVIVGMPYAGDLPFDEGKVRLYSGLTGNLIREYLDNSKTAYFGSAVSGIGDVNNDGTPDLLIGDPSAGAGDEVAVFYGARIWVGLSSRGSGIPL